MNNSKLPSYQFEDKDEPLLLDLDQQWVCDYLDKWFSDLSFQPSKLFRGALAALRPYNQKNNPEWVHQSAHSIRDILYNFGLQEGNKVPHNKDLFKGMIEITQKGVSAEEIAFKLNKLYTVFTKIAHHFTFEADFKQCKRILQDEFGITLNSKTDVPLIYPLLIDNFVLLLKKARDNMLEIHDRIDLLVQKPLSTLQVRELNILLHSHINAKRYFYLKAPIGWVTWLNGNGFFSVLNVPSENTNQYSLRLPELSYLERVIQGGGDGEEVVKVIQSTDCAGNFNPEIVHRFLFICRILPSALLVKVLPKIESERWVELMKNFSASAYMYDGMIENLAQAKEQEGLLMLAKAMLLVPRTEDDDKPFEDDFYLKDISRSGLFEALSGLDSVFAEKALKLLVEVLTSFTDEKVHLDDEPFESSDTHYVLDLDFYAIDAHMDDSFGFRDDIKALLKLAVRLVQMLFGNCEAEVSARYEATIKKLPDTPMLWRLKLFTLTRCPKTFENEIAAELERVFKTDLLLLMRGTDYIHVLQLAFPDFGEARKRDLVIRLLDAFESFLSGLSTEQERHYPLQKGWEVFSSIAAHLTASEIARASDLFNKELDSSYAPAPLEPTVLSGSVSDMSPVDFEEPAYSDPLTVIGLLKSSLVPSVLSETYKGDSIFTPRNAEGVGAALKKRVQSHVSDYLAHWESFVDCSMHVHYLFSFLEGIEAHLRDKVELDVQAIDRLFDMFRVITVRQKTDSLPEEGRWLARWVAVERAIADILKHLLLYHHETLLESKRTELIVLIRYLLQSDDPSEVDESNDPNDLDHVAINSVRGRTAEVLAILASFDGEHLKHDVLQLYKEAILNDSLVVKFTLGKHLAVFYYRDHEDVAKVFKDIFPIEANKIGHFLAAWSGYLSSPVRPELFSQLQEYYFYALGQVASDKPVKRGRTLDEGIATHIAVAFVRFNDIVYTAENKHPLLEALLEGTDVEKQKEFISFLGRGVVSHANAGEEWFRSNDVDLEKLKSLWILLLDKPLPSDVYAEFGYWVNSHQEIFDYNWLAETLARTLRKSGGRLDYTHGLEVKLLELASVNPKATLEIVEKFLLGEVAGSQRLGWFQVDQKQIDVFTLLYVAEPQKTEALINELLTRGGPVFLPLRDILKKLGQL